MKKKPARSKGKLAFSRYFQELNKGDKVAVVRELAIPANFPERLQGLTGEVEGKRGRAYFIEIKGRKFLIEPIHLRKIKN